MKKILLIASLLILSVGFSQQLIPVVETYSDGNIKSITYHKKSRTGIEKVKYEEYYKNGQKYEEGTYKDGKQDGLYTVWHENGQKEKEGTYKKGNHDGLWTRWYKNGQKYEEGTYKDGKQDGLYTEWYDNGQKRLEYTYKDGELISEECWDENGDNLNCYTSGALVGISLKQAKKFFDEGVVFVDTREDKYFTDGHIQNAWNSGFFMELLFKLDSLQTKDGPVVIYCSDDDDGSCEELAYDLYNEGFTKLFVFKGGWLEWNAAGYPTK
ncbi:MAG: rhodanese-like domain-containing protein [Candidatus Pacebacteria bacterium]|jgi:rhodanese-related sulfurtransferase|nr:rhodanese-like domain-containing protein [Candidatus Paceibacterota bacterium]